MIRLSTNLSKLLEAEPALKREIPVICRGSIMTRDTSHGLRLKMKVKTGSFRELETGLSSLEYFRSYREPGLNSQHPHHGSQPYATPVLENLTSSSDFYRHAHAAKTLIYIR